MRDFPFEFCIFRSKAFELLERLFRSSLPVDLREAQRFALPVLRELEMCCAQRNIHISMHTVSHNSNMRRRVQGEQGRASEYTAILCDSCCPMKKKEEKKKTKKGNRILYVVFPVCDY